jgi:hypothetical protein
MAEEYTNLFPIEGPRNFTQVCILGLERNHLATLLCTKNAITLATWCGGVPEEHKIMGLNPWREVLAIYGYIAKL